MSALAFLEAGAWLAAAFLATTARSASLAVRLCAALPCVAIAASTLARSGAPGAPHPLVAWIAPVAVLVAVSAWRLALARERRVGEDCLRLRVEVQRLAIDSSTKHGTSWLRLQELARLVQVGFFEADLEGRFLYISEHGAALLGLDREAALGEGWFTALAPEERAASAERWRAARAARGPWADELVLADPPRTLFAQAVPHHGENGTLTGYVGVLLDVSARVEAEEGRRLLAARAQEIERLEGLTVLAGGVAHDFNNLLTAVLGSCELLLAEMPASAPARPYLERIENAGQRAAALARKMLLLAGRTAPTREDVDLGTLANEIADLARASFGAEVLLEVVDEPLSIEADAAQLMQLLLNLATNACEAARGGAPHVEIAIRTLACVPSLEHARKAHAFLVTSAAPCVEIRVSDRGSGISGADLERIFDPFFSTKFPGRGLGLAVVLGVVRSHHGAILVDSDPGEGTRFRVFLPQRAGHPDDGGAASIDAREPETRAARQ